MRKGSQWWCEGVSKAIPEKRCAYMIVWLQRKNEVLYEGYRDEKSSENVCADKKLSRRLTDNFRKAVNMMRKTN